MSAYELDKALILKGKGCSGKLSWAKEQFKRPLIIYNERQLIDNTGILGLGNYDGIIFVNFPYWKQSYENQLALFDLKNSRPYQYLMIRPLHFPVGMRRIFTRLPEEETEQEEKKHITKFQQEDLDTRVRLVEVTGRMEC